MHCLVSVVMLHNPSQLFLGLTSAAMIGGNHGNCKAFATQEWLDTFIAQLELTWLVDGTVRYYI